MLTRNPLLPDSGVLVMEPHPHHATGGGNEPGPCQNVPSPGAWAPKPRRCFSLEPWPSFPLPFASAQPRPCPRPLQGSGHHSSLPANPASHIEQMVSPVATHPGPLLASGWESDTLGSASPSCFEKIFIEIQFICDVVLVSDVK